MKIYMETFGCTFNQADSEIMAGLLEKNGGIIVKSPENADVINVNNINTNKINFFFILFIFNRAWSCCSSFVTFWLSVPKSLHIF